MVRAGGSADCSRGRQQGRRLSEKELWLLGAGPPRRVGGAEPIRRQDSLGLSPNRPGPESKMAAGVPGDPEQGSTPSSSRCALYPGMETLLIFLRSWVERGFTGTFRNPRKMKLQTL